MRKAWLVVLAAASSTPLHAQVAAPGQRFEAADVFQLEWAADPQISPDGSQIVYVRSFFDVMTDRARSNLWIIDFDGSDHRPLTSGNDNYGSPRWSPSGDRLAYVSSQDGSSQIYVRWMDTGETAKVTNLTESPGGLTWSPDGAQLALSMFVGKPDEPWAVDMPTPPEGAEWAKPAIVIEEMNYRADGQGYLETGNTHLFVLPAEGGTPRQVTEGDFDHGGQLSWTPDSRSLVFSANRRADADHAPNDSEGYRIDVATGQLVQLTDRRGPDGNPIVSPDGSRIAYLGFDDRYQGYQVTKLYVMSADGSGSRVVADDLDRDLGGIQWDANGNGIWAQYDTEGNTKLAHVTLAGDIHPAGEDLGGLSLGRPYGGAQFTAAKNAPRFAYTYSTPEHPADLMVGGPNDGQTRITRLNDDVLGHKSLGQVEEIWWESSHDGRRVQGWIVTPPDFDPSQKYPLMLEIHGGPFSNYGDRFAAEIQLYASAGFVVLYANPRGSTSYGEEFGNLIHHNYPGQDYDDLMSGVDAVIERGYIDEDNLFVTGGSGGGVLTAWIVGKTGRFTAAAVQKPVINWYSFVLHADAPGFFYRYWFPGLPWENEEHYMSRSPISLVGSVTTPTMLITGEVDYRTPMSETEQYYAALKLEDVPTAMVRIPDSSHGIASRPSNLIAKVGHILAWFERHKGQARVVSVP